MDDVLQHPVFPDAKTTLLVMLGHGSKSLDGSIEKVGFPLWPGSDGQKQRLSIAQLGKSIARRKVKKPLRILCATCYGGGIHHITSTTPNVCGASTTIYSMISKSWVPQSQFIEGFWEDIVNQGDLKKSFGEAVLAAYRKDEKNIGIGQLSSFDYIDRILERGQYNTSIDQLASITGKKRARKISRPPKTAIPVEAHLISGIDEFLRPNKYGRRSSTPGTHPERSDSRSRELLPPGSTLVDLIESIIGPSDEAGLSESDKERNRRHQIRLLKERVQALKAIGVPSKFIKILNEEISQLRELPISEFPDDLVQNIQDYRTDAAAFFNTVRKATEISNTIEEKEEEERYKDLKRRNAKRAVFLGQDLIDWENSQKFIETKKKELKKEQTLQENQFKDLEKSYSKVFKYSHTLSKIGDLETALTTHEFNRFQKDKLIELLKCEWETPL